MDIQKNEILRRSHMASTSSSSSSKSEVMSVSLLQDLPIGCRKYSLDQLKAQANRSPVNRVQLNFELAMKLCLCSYFTG
jgi:hypothetical protein